MEIIWITFVGNYALRICDFGGRWSVTLKNRVVVWQLVPTFKEAVPPPPPPPAREGLLFFDVLLYLHGRCTCRCLAQALSHTHRDYTSSSIEAGPVIGSFHSTL